MTKPMKKAAKDSWRKVKCKTVDDFKHNATFWREVATMALVDNRRLTKLCARALRAKERHRG